LVNFIQSAPEEYSPWIASVLYTEIKKEEKDLCMREQKVPVAGEKVRRRQHCSADAVVRLYQVEA
jgi:hypothetical protein